MTRFLAIAILLTGSAFAQQMAGPLLGTTPESRAAYIAKEFDLVFLRCKKVPISDMKNGPTKRRCLKQSERMP